LAGIYLHIPFCKQKCYYCNFYSLASQKHRDEFADSILKEISLRSDYLQGEGVETIYFGGGTPSIIDVDEIKKILDELSMFFNIEEDAEITLEANPDDLDKNKLIQLASSPVNRLSIGVQSFFKEDLAYLHRVHSGEQAYQSVVMAGESGFSNLTIDLIYGIPTLSNDNWDSNLQKFLSLGLGHLSAYSLTVEPKTPLENFIRKGKIVPVLEQQAIDHYEILTSTLDKAGYLQYEISNFCQEGHYSRHNTSYWSGKKYLGLGPSAHSFDGESRQWNISNLSIYINSITAGKLEIEREVLTQQQKYNEYILVSLRTIWGVDIQKIEKYFGLDFRKNFENEAIKYLDSGELEKLGDKYWLTNKGKLFADGISAGLFV
jgi:oxygen-independent coproporphyrinogen-3 oxidase